MGPEYPERFDGEVGCGWGVPAPITGGTVDGHRCPKTLAFRNPLLGAQTRAHLGLISTCPAGGSVREGGGETWG